jgi:putative acetyltransferase
LISTEQNANRGLDVAGLGLMTPEDIVIAAMSTTDVATVKEMICQGIGAFEEAGTVLASTFRRLEQFSEVYDTAGSIYVVAKDRRAEQAGPNAVIVGGAGLGPLHGLAPSEGVAEIRDLVVRPQWRGHGIGARLLKRCLDEAKRLGYQRLYLEATPHMEQAQKLFIRYGFRPVTTGAAKVGASETMPCYFILESLA